MSLNKWERNGGIYLGRDPGRTPTLTGPTAKPVNLLSGVWPAGARTHEYVGDRHLLMFGPNGSGKSWRVLMPNLCRLTDWSMVVVDPKGALAAHTAIHRAQLDAKGQPTRKIVVIDPFRVIEETYPHLVARFPFFKSSGLNPVAMLDPASKDEESVDDAKAMAEAIVKIDPKGEAHWALSAQSLVKGLLLARQVKARAKNTNSSLGEVRKWITTPPELMGPAVAGMCEEMDEKYPAISGALNRFRNIRPESRELFGILSTAITQTDWLDSPRIRRDLDAGSFDFGLLKREPVTVYLVLPPRYLATHATWLRLMITTILLPLLRSVESAPVPVLFALDEYAALGHMEVIENNMALMREYGVKLFPVLQDLTQLKDVHPERWESFIGNAGIRFLFAPQDSTTQQYFSAIGGQSVWTYQAQSDQTGGGFSGGIHFNASTTTGEHKSLTPRIAPEHLGSIRQGQAVLYVAETRSGRANIVRRSVLPDPRSIPYDSSIGRGVDVLNDTARVISEAQAWMTQPTPRRRQPRITQQ